jgi:hypothetical protein
MSQLWHDINDPGGFIPKSAEAKNSKIADMAPMGKPISGPQE